MIFAKPPRRFFICNKQKTLKPDGFGVFCIAGAKFRNGGKGAVFYPNPL
ncbi:hypothetical protein NEILACOT_04922 [Neisseria lactamica ATCC 23970]|uniref:Uncharacterized protein n=1 Tax=Neisseria lactamica ATCC 23970 TaxID=546265 RepID=D0WBJ5_NEILA|nr:hypothetical protein NEILACOT_04922 [Neisseria lactamica ATCC 23970]